MTLRSAAPTPIDARPVSWNCSTIAPIMASDWCWLRTLAALPGFLLQLNWNNALLRARGIELAPADAPSYFTDPSPTAEVVRQILGATIREGRARRQAAPCP